jgi:hypothetical protein
MSSDPVRPSTGRRDRPSTGRRDQADFFSAPDQVKRVALASAIRILNPHDESAATAPRAPD